jgi:hypothetical protein
MKVDEVGKILCKGEYSIEQLHDFGSRVADEYRVNWFRIFFSVVSFVVLVSSCWCRLVDNLPAATKYFTEGDVGSDGLFAGF